MRRRPAVAVGAIAMALGLCGCGKSEPVYSGISVIGRNYLPYNMTIEGPHMQQSEAKIATPPAAIPEKVGNQILDVHFYPDRHVELQFPGELLGDSRIPITDVSRWMAARYQAGLDERFQTPMDSRIGVLLAL